MKLTCDLYDEFGTALEVIPFGLTSYGAKTRFYGPVETIKCYEDNSRIKELSKTAGTGKVLVVDAGGSMRNAVMGDVIAGNFAANGWAGIVIWGAVRDVTQLAELNIGILALAHIPRPGIRVGDGQIGVDIRLGDARIGAGGFLVSDEDGTVIFPPTMPPPTI
jgi:regulator of ribonuclease activity A